MACRPLRPKETQALRFIQDKLVHTGESPSVRQLQEALGYSSPNAANYILEQLIKAGYLRRREDRKLQLLRDVAEDPAHARTVKVSLVGSVPCGVPLLAEQNVEAEIQVSIHLAPQSHLHFLLLRDLGLTHVPCLVQRITRMEELEEEARLQAEAAVAREAAEGFREEVKPRPRRKRKDSAL